MHTYLLHATAKKCSFASGTMDWRCGHSDNFGLEHGAIQDARTFRTGLYTISVQANLCSENMLNLHVTGLQANAPSVATTARDYRQQPIHVS